MCFTVSPIVPTNNDLKNPNFQFGRVHVAVSILVIIFCFFGKVVYLLTHFIHLNDPIKNIIFYFLVTVGSLILRQRYRRNISASSYSNLLPPVENDRIRSGRNVVDVEDLVSPTVGPQING